MKKKVVIILGIFIFIILVYGFVLYQNDYGVISKEDYINNSPCGFSKLNDGWTQLSTCVEYKFLGDING